jgi:hypothetical protein
MHGFKRLTFGRDKGCYYHEFFLRSKRFLARNIKRIRVKGLGARKPGSPDTEPNFYVGPFLPKESNATQYAASAEQQKPSEVASFSRQTIDQVFKQQADQRGGSDSSFDRTLQTLQQSSQQHRGAASLLSASLAEARLKQALAAQHQPSRSLSASIGLGPLQDVKLSLLLAGASNLGGGMSLPGFHQLQMLSSFQAPPPLPSTNNLDALLKVLQHNSRQVPVARY